MCRMIGFSLKRPLSAKRLKKLIAHSRDLLKDQSDGFGYALSGGNLKGITHLRLTTGKLLGYRYSSLGEWGNFAEPGFDSKGNLGCCTAGLFHGRISTNDLGVHNTHPFVSNDLALAHNGIVEYSGPKRSKKGTCDSEDLFNTFTVGDGWKELPKHYSGYAALLMLRKNGELTLYRDDTPKLNVIRFNGGFVAATSVYDGTELVRKVFGQVPEAPFLLKPGYALVTKLGRIIKTSHVGEMTKQSFDKDSRSLGTDKTWWSSKGKQTDWDYDDGYDAGYYDCEHNLEYKTPSSKSKKYQDGYGAGYTAAEKNKGEGEEIDSDEPVELATV